MFGSRKVAMIVAEALGVYVLSMVVYSMLARTTFPLFSGLAAGLTIGIFTLIIGNISGAHINPAVTVSAWVMKRIDTVKAIVYIAAQVLGGLAAWATIRYFLGHSLTNMAGSKFQWRVAIGEGLGTAVFGFGLVAAMLNKLDNVRAAFVIGSSFALGVMVASLGSTGILNPAVALGIQSWNWSYAVGPIFGAIIGTFAYLLLFSASNGLSKKTKK